MEQLDEGKEESSNVGREESNIWINNYYRRVWREILILLVFKYSRFPRVMGGIADITAEIVCFIITWI